MKITDKCPKCGQQLQGKVLRHINLLAISCENCEYHAAINIAPDTSQKEEIAK
jgi:transcription elongation factor Elf1